MMGVVLFLWVTSSYMSPITSATFDNYAACMAAGVFLRQKYHEYDSSRDVKFYCLATNTGNTAKEN